ncbi:MAG: TonB C-terminal domain-containing protein [Tabrizicola sp.]|jgi:Na+-transporting methylmalonyl-CoA/oxaloacetate decarboxylase beta subunit|nr:TonB C-terminal domain-containing protein [Tabrizicola sp.]
MKGLALKLALVASVIGQPVLAELDQAALAAKISQFWSIAGADADTLASRVVVRVTFAQDGKPTDFQLIEAAGPSQAGIDALFAVARRAVLRAHADGGLPLSPADHDSWRVIDLVFGANGMPVS